MSTRRISNIYLHLKDKSLTIEDRLQLVRYSWRSQDVVLPNKEQVLVDILTGWLINKKKEQLAEKEEILVWSCLKDVLQTKAATEQNRVFFRQSAIQLFTDALSVINEKCGFLSSLIGCFQAIMNSDSLSTIFTSKLDVMVSILRGICVMGTLQQDGQLAGSAVSFEQLVGLSVSTVTRFTAVLKTSPNQNQILQKTCDVLLPVFLPLWSTGPTDMVKTLSTAVQAVLCHRDHQQSYDVYLKARHSKTGGHVHKRAKMVEHVFETLSQLLKTQPTACCSYLPVFYESFIENNCHHGFQLTAHYLMLEFCSLLAVTSDASDLHGPLDVVTVFRGVNLLLKVIQGRELYDQLLDEKNGSPQVQFYKHVVQLLVACKQNNEREISYRDWYSCLTHLLCLNHHILEPRLLEILTVGWISAQVKEEDGDALDEFLHQLITTYSKLRQIPKLVTKLLASLCTAKDSTALQLTPKFLSSYGEIVTALPQGMMIDIWKKFLAALKLNFVDPETRQNTGHFQGVSALFYHYLLNVKVADYTVTELTLKSIQELLVVMETDIFTPVLTGAMEDKETERSQLQPVLFLSHAWGEVMAMLGMYCRYRLVDLQTKPVVSHCGDLSYLHSYMDKKHWLKLYKAVRKHGDAPLQYIWDMLVIQKVRTVLLFRDVSDWSHVTDAMTTMMTSFEDTKVDSDSIWSGKIEDVTGNNLVTARWQLLTSNMAAIHTAFTEEQRRTLANFAVRCLVDGGLSPTKNVVCLYDISSELLRSPTVKESRSLLNYIITAVWSQCRNMSSAGQSPSPKKKKKTDKTATSLGNIMSVFGDWEHTEMNSESLEQLQEASKSLTVILSSEDNAGMGNTKHWLKCVQILQSLPLDSLESCDQIRCLIGLLAFKCMTDKAEDKKGVHTELSSLCMELVTWILEACGIIPVFQVIDIHSYLSWLMKILGSYEQRAGDYQRCLVMAEMSCQAVVKDYSVLEKLPEFTHKLCEDMETKEFISQPKSGALTLTLFIMQEICKILNRPYTTESLKKTCSEIYQPLSKVVMKLSPILSSSKLSHEEAVIVRICSAMLSTIHKEEGIKEKFLEVFPKMLQWSERVLQDEDRVDVYTVMSSLTFIYTVSKYHTLLQTALETDNKLTLWNLLITTLKKILTNKTGSLENPGLNQSVTQVADAQLGNQSKGKETHNQPDKKEHKKSRKDAEMKDSLIQRGGSLSDILQKRLDEMNLLLGGTNSPQDVVDSKLHGINDAAIDISLDSSRTDTEDTVYTSATINSLCRSFMFEGRLVEERSRIIKMQVQAVMATLLLTFDLDLFREVTQELVDTVHTSLILSDRGKIQLSLYVWKQLLKLEFSDEQSKVIKKSAKDMMLNLQCIVEQLEHIKCEDVVRDITVPILQTQQHMLLLGPKFLPSRSSIVCLYSCIYTPLGGSTYFPAFSALCEVLDTFIVKHEETVFQNIPAFIGCAKRLLLSVVEQSNQEKITQKPDVIKQLMTCAYLMERLFSEISSHKTEFGKVAVYVVADYVTAVQRVTLYPAVKRALVPAVYKMLDLCDRHAISQLHVVLPHGVAEVFRILYSEYTKFHKYQGKV